MKDIYIEFIKCLTTQKVKYIVTGVSGINYYADNASQIIFTQDYDIFIKPTLNNLKKTLDILKKLKFSIYIQGKQIKISLKKY